MVDIGRRLNGHTLVGIDTSIWIYHLEDSPRYSSLTTDILNTIATGRPRAVISVVTITELTVQPYRLDQPNIAANYEAHLTHFPNAQLHDVTAAIARRAAQLRGVYSLRTADALLVATSLVAGATAWITNDRALRRLAPLIDIILLDDLLEGHI